jgi:hypothetical protein
MNQAPQFGVRPLEVDQLRKPLWATDDAIERTGPESPMRKLAKSRKPRRPLEHLEQVRLINWSSDPETLKRYPELEGLAAIPNGGKRTKIVAMKLKAEGVKKGYPDLVLDVARGPYHGWKGELKARGGSAKPDQKTWHERLRRQGYRVDVRIGWEAMRDALIEYLNLEN